MLLTIQGQALTLVSVSRFPLWPGIRRVMHTRWRMHVHYMLHYRRQTWPWNPKSLIMDSNHVFPLLQREKIYLPKLFAIWLYLNEKKIVQRKFSWCLSEDMQKHKRPNEKLSPTHKMLLHSEQRGKYFEPDFDIALHDNYGGKERTWNMKFISTMC